MERISDYIHTLPKVELIGIVAGLLVLAGFLFRKVAVIRSIGLLACCMYIWYGISINSPSIIIINGTVAVVHIVYLVKILLSKHKEKKRWNR